MKLCVETVGLPATVTRSKAEAGSMTHQLPLPHNDLWQEIMWACCLTYRILCAGKRSREAGSVEDGEAGPSKKPRTGVQACFLFCSVLHPVDEFAVWGVSGWCERGAPLAFCEDL